MANKPTNPAQGPRPAGAPQKPQQRPYEKEQIRPSQQPRRDQDQE